MNNKFRFQLLTWLIAPIVLIWFSTNYIVGSLNQKEMIAVPTIASDAKKYTYSKPISLEKFVWNGTGLVTIWMDDAWISQYNKAFPLLRENGYKAALAVPTQLVGYNAYMSWDQIRRLQHEGWETTSHTRTHTCTLDKDGVSKVEYELHGAQEDLAVNGLRSDQFVTPCGVSSSIMLQVAKKYYLSYRTSEPGFNNIPVDDPYNLLVQTMRRDITPEDVQGWIDEARNEKKWLIIMFHQIDDSHSEYSVKKETFKKILNEIKLSGLPVVLPGQVLEVGQGDAR